MAGRRHEFDVTSDMRRRMECRDTRPSTIFGRLPFLRPGFYRVVLAEKWYILFEFDIYSLLNVIDHVGTPPNSTLVAQLRHGEVIFVEVHMVGNVPDVVHLSDGRKRVYV